MLYLLTKPLHLVALSQYLFALYYDFNYLVVPEHVAPTIVQPGCPGGRSRFLTYWCLVSLKIFGQNYQKYK